MSERASERVSESHKHVRWTRYERVSFKLGDGIAGRVAATALPLSDPQAAGESGVDVTFDEQLGCKINQALCQPILGNNGHVRVAFHGVNCLVRGSHDQISLIMTAWVFLPGTWRNPGCQQSQHA